MLTFRRTLKNLLKSTYFLVYRFGTRLGFTLLPTHYYSSEPNVLELERTKDVWSQPLSLRGIHMDADEQLAYIRSVCGPYEQEYRGNRTFLEGMSDGYGPGYGYIEAQALHAIVRHHKPRRIVEVGSGVSTLCMLESCRLNEDESGTHSCVTCVEPYPSRKLQELVRDSPRAELLQYPVQEVPLTTFSQLMQGDILFVDSSHVLKTGSDVERIVLEVLPTLAPGVLVHFHDIYFPYAYQRDVLRTFLHQNETPLLAAFLTFNPKFKILACLSYLHYARPDDLKAVFREYRRQADWRGLVMSEASGAQHFPASTWLQVVG